MFIQHRHRYQGPEEELGGGGGEVETSIEPPGQEVQATQEAAKPATMLEAISQSLEQGDKPGQPRDEQGRFAQKAAEKAAEEAAQKAKPEAKPEAKTEAKPKPEDALKMPEGLSQSGQQRFQQLASMVKERDATIAQQSQQLEYVKSTFQEHGVTREQFEQAAGFIGAINRGDLRGALKVLDEQRQQIALALGEALPGVDVLANFPDLRQRVDQLQISEQDAIELAKLRRNQQQQQDHATQARQTAEQQQQEQQLVQKATTDVDAWCRQMAASDLDWPVIEERLLPHIQALLSGVHPSRWVETLKTQYSLLKSVAAPRPQATAGTVLRPNGGGATTSAPKTAFEAMWGKPQPA